MNINSKIKLKDISVLDINQLISSIHCIEISHNVLTVNENCRVIQKENLSAFQIRDKGLYEYIYDSNSNQLLIHIESDENTHQLINQLIKKQWIDDSSYLHISNKPLKIRNINDLTYAEGAFLIVYLHQSDYNERLYQKLSTKLKGIAYVVYGDDLVDEVVCKHYGINHKSFALLFNNDILDIRYSNEKELYELMCTRIERYMSHCVYDYPFSFNHLYRQVLIDMLNEESSIEKQHLFNHDVQINDLKMKQDELLSRIEKKEKEIENLKILIDLSKAQLDSKKGCPIMFKGKENDLYSNEQKDFLITLLKEEYERIKDYQGEDRKKQLIESLLELNKESGVRVKFLEDLRILLEPITRNLSPKELEQLKQLGFDMKKGEGHYKGNFFEDPRYTLTISSSASDANAGHVAYRRIRNDYF